MKLLPRGMLFLFTVALLVSAADTPAQSAKEADKLIAQGKLKQAIPLYRKTLAADPSDDALRQRFFLALMEDHKWKEAGTLIDSAPVSFTKRAYFPSLYGEFLLHKGEFEKALTVLESAMRENPDPNGLHALYTVQGILHMADGARKTVDVLVKKFPKHPRSKLALAEKLADQHKFKDAAMALKDYIRLNKFDDSLEEKSAVGRDALLFALAERGRSPWKVTFQAESESLPMTMLPGVGLPSIQLKVNGVETEFLFDSGATENVIFEDFAGSASIKTLSSGSAYGIGGEGKRGTGIVNLLEIGSAKIQDVPVSIIAKDGQMAMLAKRWGGILSPQSFEHLIFALDYPDRKLHIMRAADYAESLRLMGSRTGEQPGEKIVRYTLPYYRVANLFVLRAAINGASVLGLFDTGAPLLLLGEQLVGNAVPKDKVQTQGIPLGGIGAEERFGYMVTEPITLGVGGASLKPLMTIICDIAVLQEVGTNLEAVIGGTCFASYRVVFDTKNGQLLLERKLEN